MRRLASALLLAVLGCGGRSHPGEVQGPNKLSEVAVVVENQHTATLNLYLESNGRSVRIGEVHFSETRSFVMPWRSLSQNGVVSLRGEVVGSDQSVGTGAFTLTPGSMVRWTLTPRLEMSYYAVY